MKLYDILINGILMTGNRLIQIPCVCDISDDDFDKVADIDVGTTLILHQEFNHDLDYLVTRTQ